jgi:CheY-like chemotaxis protein
VDSLTEEFLTCASVCAKPLRELCQSLLQCPDEKDRQGKLADAFLGISALISLNHSGISHPAFQLAVALEGLLKKMLQDAKHSTDSALGTVVTAADLLDELCSSEIKNDIATDPPVGVLVVDDDLLMRRVIAGALQTFFARPEIAESGEGALEAVAKKSFDVIFMDITMPGMDGFETCANIRKSVLNGTTPVVFVTSLTDFQTHAKMSHIGGNDLMAKPFLTAEINVKALTYALRGRMERSKAQPVAG